MLLLALIGPVEILQVEPGPFTVTRRYMGSIASTKRALISAQVSARVKAVEQELLSEPEVVGLGIQAGF